MDQEKWENLIMIAKEKFGLQEVKKESNELGVWEDGAKIMEDKEIIEFDSPMGKIKLERTTKPKVIDKKAIYSRRIGGSANIEYIYSKEETTCQFKAFKWNQDQNLWQEITYNF